MHLNNHFRNIIAIINIGFEETDESYAWLLDAARWSSFLEELFWNV